VLELAFKYNVLALLLSACAPTVEEIRGVCALATVDELPLDPFSISWTFGVEVSWVRIEEFNYSSGASQQTSSTRNRGEGTVAAKAGTVELGVENLLSILIDLVEAPDFTTTAISLRKEGREGLNLVNDDFVSLIVERKNREVISFTRLRIGDIIAAEECTRGFVLW
jgi:hypothetical protein